MCKMCKICKHAEYADWLNQSVNGSVVPLAMFFLVHLIVNDGLQIVIAIAALDDICFAMELPLSSSPGLR